MSVSALRCAGAWCDLLLSIRNSTTQAIHQRETGAVLEASIPVTFRLWLLMARVETCARSRTQSSVMGALATTTTVTSEKRRLCIEDAEEVSEVPAHVHGMLLEQHGPCPCLCFVAMPITSCRVKRRSGMASVLLWRRKTFRMPALQRVANDLFRTYCAIISCEWLL
eukprot:2242051-Amphidinium_carterae.1